MSTTEIIIIGALVGYAVYKQTRVNRVSGSGRFRLALVYAIVGISLGLYWPHSIAAAALIGASLIVSVVVGVARGATTKVWRDGDGQVLSQGSAVTIGLFLALIASKFVLGAIAEGFGVHDSSVGEILLMIAASVAVQAQIVWRRAQAISAGSTAARPVRARVS